MSTFRRLDPKHRKVECPVIVYSAEEVIAWSERREGSRFQEVAFSICLFPQNVHTTDRQSHSTVRSESPARVFDLLSKCGRRRGDLHMRGKPGMIIEDKRSEICCAGIQIGCTDANRDLIGPYLQQLKRHDLINRVINRNGLGWFNG